MTELQLWAPALLLRALYPPRLNPLAFHWPALPPHTLTKLFNI